MYARTKVATTKAARQRQAAGGGDYNNVRIDRLGGELQWISGHPTCWPRRVPRPRIRISVAIVLTSFDRGGTERQMVELVRRLDRGACDVHLACFRAEGP